MYRNVSLVKLTIVPGCIFGQVDGQGMQCGAVLRLVYLVVPKVMVTVSDTSADIG